MKKTEKRKTVFLIGISSIAIVLLIFVNINSAQTTQDQYANYFASVTEASVNLTRAFQDQIGLWQLGQISNNTMAEITNKYIINFTSQLNEFNETEAPEAFLETKENLLNSFVNEIKSYEFFRDYLLSGNETKNDISTQYLSQALQDEASAFKAYEKIINQSISR
ncbi:hypothetical protein [Candidatus Nitrosocosmicus franklandus]|uniref:Uncharacterized protein n=1 Tax=Candidatus Nitrosocosmicus franklandianus TaxID=1798806 RepID=A0A484I5G2_9ARCH|nr:hypothetical protein [Candidatus Nitrosocosmicus franklandus]VFJ12428.1 conserved exported protein of unknown function [Candidatus Nitrosocosmicus franklandus]